MTLYFRIVSEKFCLWQFARKWFCILDKSICNPVTFRVNELGRHGFCFLGNVFQLCSEKLNSVIVAITCSFNSYRAIIMFHGKLNCIPAAQSCLVYINRRLETGKTPLQITECVRANAFWQRRQERL